MSVDGKPGEGPRGELSAEDRAALERRSSELGRKLEEVRRTEEARRPGGQGGAGGDKGQSMARALRLSGELIAGVVVGGAIGWWLDKWLGNEKPWLFILFFLLGAAAGLMNLIRAAMRETTPPQPSVKDERDKDN